MIDVVLLFLFTYFVLQLVTAIIVSEIKRKQKQKMKEDIGAFLAEAEERIKEITFLRVEQHGDVFYLYNQVTNDFVCQGKNLDEIKEAYHIRFPGKKALVDEGGELLFKESANV